MKQLTIILFVLSVFQIQAQVGLSMSYINQNADQWEELAIEQYGNSAENNFLNSGYELGVDYWWRIEKFRIEFFPTLSYALLTTKLDNPLVNDLGLIREGKYNQSNIGLHLKTNIYPLDFGGDCDCPTWKKDGNVIKKGWFIQLIGGAKSMITKYKFNDYSSSDQSILFEAGLGTGLDIGVSEFLTVTPYINYIHTFNAEWLQLDELPTNANGFPFTDEFNSNVTDMNRLVFGVRLGFRFDELNKYGFR